MEKEKTLANVGGMAVTVTLVFSDELHRDAWMRRMGMLDNPSRHADYEHRRQNTDLMYLVGPERGSSRGPSPMG